MTMADKGPGFFILGAPKCGTTSLANWLTAHPDVFMCPVKEPHFFNTDHGNRMKGGASTYQWLFRDVAPNHRAIGEASVWYLYSRTAVANILEYNPAARFIVCLRNPVAMAYSLHEQQVFAGNEPVSDFREAWELQSERVAGRSVPRGCTEPAHLLYGPACSLGTQVERLLDRVDRERVHFVLLDDLNRDSGESYRAILNHIGVSDDGRSEFPRLNSAKERRSMALRHVMRFINNAKKQLGVPPLNSGMWNRLNRANARERRRAPMSPEMQTTLTQYFESEIDKLAVLLGRDLSAWKSGPGETVPARGPERLRVVR